MPAAMVAMAGKHHRQADTVLEGQRFFHVKQCAQDAEVINGIRHGVLRLDGFNCFLSHLLSPCRG